MVIPEFTTGHQLGVDTLAILMRSRNVCCIESFTPLRILDFSTRGERGPNSYCPYMLSLVAGTRNAGSKSRKIRENVPGDVTG